MRLSKSDQGFVLIWAKKLMGIKMLGGKCQKCGENDVTCLAFHHTRDKTDTINKLRALRWSVLSSEMKKCELLCHNCHEAIHSNPGRNALARAKLLQHIGADRCTECGHIDKTFSSLDFHHVRDKRFSMSQVATRQVKVDWEMVLSELDKCVVLCSNCHSKKHANKEKLELFATEIAKRVNTHRELHKPVDREEVLSLYESGMKQIDIAKKLGYTKGTISQIIMKFHPHSVPAKVDRIKVIQLHADGHNQKEIAELLKCDHSTVSRIICLQATTGIPSSAGE